MNAVKPVTPYVVSSYLDKEEETWLKENESQRVWAAVDAREVEDSEKKAEEKSGNWLSTIWNASMSAMGSVLPPVKNVAGLLSVNRDGPPEKEEGCGFLWYKCWLLPWIDSMKRPSTSAANATVTSIAQSAQETAWAQITQTAQVILTSTPLPQSTPTPILPDYQAYKLTGPLTEWEAEYGGQMAFNAHLLQPYFSNFEFWSEGIEINGDPPWAGQGDLKNMPIPMLYQNGKLSWYVINQGQIGVVNVPETDNWINNKFSSTREGAKPISQIFEYTNNKIPFVCGDVPDWQHFMVGHNLQLDFPKIAEQYPTGRWPRSAYGWVTLFFNAPSDFHFVDLRTINTNTYRFTNENLPELGDTIVTQFGDNVMSTSGEDATHVGSVVEIKGYGLEQIIVFEGNTGSNSLTFTTLKQFIEREGGQMKYILYGHPTLP